MPRAARSCCARQRSAASGGLLSSTCIAIRGVTLMEQRPGASKNMPKESARATAYPPRSPHRECPASHPVPDSPRANACTEAAAYAALARAAAGGTGPGRIRAADPPVPIPRGNRSAHRTASSQSPVSAATTISREPAWWPFSWVERQLADALGQPSGRRQVAGGDRAASGHQQGIGELDPRRR